jgi:hypothetical protein
MGSISLVEKSSFVSFKESGSSRDPMSGNEFSRLSRVITRLDFRLSELSQDTQERHFIHIWRDQWVVGWGWRVGWGGERCQQIGYL